MKLTKFQKIILIYIPTITAGSFFIFGFLSFFNLKMLTALFLNITVLGIISIPLSIFVYICSVIYRKIYKRLPENKKENIRYFIESFKIMDTNKISINSSQQEKVLKKVSKRKLILNIFTVLNVLLFYPSLGMVLLSVLGLHGSENWPLLYKLHRLPNYIGIFFPLVLVLSVIISRISFISRIKKNSNNFKLPLFIVMAPITIALLCYVYVVFIY